MKSTVRALLAAAAIAAPAVVLTGCGGSDVEEVQMSPAARKADTAGQEAMQEYMRSQMQGQSRP